MATNKEIVENAYASFATGDVPAALGATADDIQWTTRGRRSKALKRFMIFRVLCAAALFAVLSTGALASNASAATGSTSFTCSKLTSTGTGAAMKIKFSGCGGKTGGHSKVLSGAVLGGGFIRWSNGKYTETYAPEISGIPVQCPSGLAGGAIQFAVEADTTGSAAVGTLTSWETCPTLKGGIRLAPKTLAVF